MSQVIASNKLARIRAWVHIKAVCLFWDSRIVSYEEINAPQIAIRSARLKINFASIIASKSTIAVFQFLDRPNVWRTDSHAKINVGTASISYAKINALINTITVFLSSANKAVLMWEINVLHPVIQYAPRKRKNAWWTVPMNTKVVPQPSVRQPALIIGSIAIISAL